MGVTAPGRVTPAELLTGARALSASEARIGGKAFGLARLARAGACVPPWLVIPTEAFAAHLTRGGIADAVARELQRLARLDLSAPDGLAAISAASAWLRPAVEREELDPALAAALAEALPALAPGPFAVRSSAVGEDSERHSFAGQFDSFLCVPDAAAVAAAVIRCWGSALSPRALSYRLRASGPPRRDGAATQLLDVAVVVQQMVSGGVSGVAFTTNPVTGRPDEALVSACWGLGEGVVSGLCDADEYACTRDGRERVARIAVKGTQVTAGPGGAGSACVEVPEASRSVRCLSPDEVRLVSAEAFRLESALGAPLDVEWTLDGDQLVILQARPITSRLGIGDWGLAGLVALDLPVAGGTSSPQSPVPSPQTVWDNSNIQESYCGVTTPLTFSFARAAYESVYVQTLRVLGVPERVIAAHRPLLRNLLGLIRGRVYYNINNWYRGLLLFPSFGRNKADMERMMGLDSPVEFVQDQLLSIGEKARRLPRLLRTYAGLLARFARLGRDVERFLAEFERIYGRVDRRRLRTAGIPELVATGAALRAELLERWHTPIVNDFFVMMSTGRLGRIVRRAARDEAPLRMQQLLGGIAGIESTEPVRLLMRLARVAREDPTLARTLCAGTPADALRRVRAEHAHFAAALDEYLERYGDRCMGELKLETVALREEPGFVVQVLRNYLDRPDLDPDRLADRERRACREAEALVARRLGWLARRRFRRALRDARAGVRDRERMRLARTRTFGLFRDLYRAVGERLHEAGRLDAPRDVFYLTTDEITAYSEGTAVSAELAPIARARRAEYAAYEAQELPHRFTTVGAPYHGHGFAPARAAADDAVPAATPRVLTGIGCSPGVVEGELRIVTSPRDDLAINGKILTALRTDPGWGPLFPSAAGILIERGSTLSHSAVLARELGIPAVVGVPDLLRIVRDGERVRLDGAAGIVERREVP